MNEIVADNPEREIHAVLDNLNTPKPKCDRWLQRRRNVYFHFALAYSSCLNQVECCFSLLSRRALKGSSFTSPEQVRDAVDRFVNVYNDDATPFEWRKASVHGAQPKLKYAQLRSFEY